MKGFEKWRKKGKMAVNPKINKKSENKKLILIHFFRFRVFCSRSRFRTSSVRRRTSGSRSNVFRSGRRICRIESTRIDRWSIGIGGGNRLDVGDDDYADGRQCEGVFVLAARNTEPGGEQISLRQVQSNMVITNWLVLAKFIRKNPGSL